MVVPPALVEDIVVPPYHTTYTEDIGLLNQ